MIDAGLQVQWLNTAGLFWGFSGAIALSRGFFGLSNEQLKRLSGSYYGANPSAVRSFCEQRLDTRFGVVQLIVGSAIQILSNLGFSVTLGWAFGITIILVPVWFYFLATYKERSAREAIHLSITPDATEAAWRSHFTDLSDLEWARIVINDDIKFQEA